MQAKTAGPRKLVLILVLATVLVLACLHSGIGSQEDSFQTHAATGYGNSGGPLVKMRGKVTGINTAVVSRTGINEGIGPMARSDLAKRTRGELVGTGRVVRDCLGVRTQQVDQERPKSFELRRVEAALVTQAFEDRPAGEARLGPIVSDLTPELAPVRVWRRQRCDGNGRRPCSYAADKRLREDMFIARV